LVYVKPFSWPTNDFYYRVYSLTAPVIIPCTKYFCTKGYKKIIGPMVITVTAIFIVSEGSVIPAAAPEGIRPELMAFTFEIIV